MLGILGPSLLPSNHPPFHANPVTRTEKDLRDGGVDTHLVRSRNREVTFCFKTSNDTGYNDSKVTCIGTSFVKFGVHLSCLFPGGTPEVTLLDGYLLSLKSGVVAV